MLKQFLNIILALFILSVNSLTAQNNFASEDELKKEADRLFYEKQYDKCLPLFSQLLSLYPKDPNYNYKYGASALFGTKDKEKPLRYLKFAASKPNVNPEAYYFLARAYHLNYEFDAAITYYNKFKSKADKKLLAKYDADLQIKMCQNGKTLLSNIKNIKVLEKKEVKRSDFFRSYKLDGINGKIIVKPDEFKTKYDLKVNETSIIYYPENAREVFFSSYGKDGANGKDIFRVVKLPNGEWSKPTALSPVINTKYDEEYPFMHPDGKTLYFCSKGHNSMGGYDVFKSEYDAVSGSWSKPVNLDFAISSADDDILFISDSANLLAYFASARESAIGYVTVYKVTVEAPLAEQFAMIKGRVINETKPDKSFAKITIIDPETGKTIGIQHTNDKGEYLIMLPKPNKEYKFLVETTENAPIHSARITVPPVDENYALKQELIFTGEPENQKMVVKNMFDEKVSITPEDPLYVEHVIKRSAKLDVNASEEDIKQLANAENQTADNSNVTSEISRDEALTKAETALNEITELYQKAQKEANAAYKYAYDKSQEAAEKLKEVNELKSKYNNETLSEAEKQSLNKEIKQKEFAATLAANEANTAYALALGLESDAQAKKQDADKLEQLLNNLEAADENEITSIYNNVETVFNDATATDLSTVIEKQRLKEKYEQTQEKLNKQEQYVRELKNNRNDIKQQIAELEEKRNNSKKKKEYEELDAQLATLKIDLDDINLDIENAEKKLSQLKTETAITQQAYTSGEKMITAISQNETASPISVEQKNQLTYQLGAFEQDNLLAHYPVQEVNENQTITNDNEENQLPEQTISYADLKEDYDIIDDEGNLKNYAAEYSNQLAETDQLTDQYQKNLQIAKINQDWINDIDKEIEIKQKIANSTSNVSQKTQLENDIASLQTLKAEKQREVQELLASTEQLAQENQPEENVTTNSPKNTQIVDVENIPVEDESGNIIDFVTPIEEELQAAESIENEQEKNLAKAKAYQKWVNATNEVIALKQLDLAQASDDEKPYIESEIQALQSIADEKYQLAQEFYEKSQATELASTETSSETENINEQENTSFNQIPDNLKQSEIFDENGNISNYNEKYQTQIANITNDSPEDVSKKQSLLTQWNKAIEDELIYQKNILENTDSSTEKEAASAKIEQLEQQLEINNIELDNSNEILAQLQTTNKESNTQEETVENTVSEETAENTTTNQNTTDNENQILRENETNTTKTEQPNELITQNTVNESIANTINETPLDQYQPTEEDNYSDIKYNNNVQYQFPSAQQDLLQAKSLKLKVAELKQESNQLKAQMQTTNDEQKRTELLAQADEKEKQAEQIELQIANNYAEANKNEYFNNQSILNNLGNKIRDNDNASFAEVMADEAQYYMEEAKKLREQAADNPNFSSKAGALQKAYEYELKAIDKQRKAISIYQKAAPEETANILASTEVISTQRNSSTTTNTTTDNNQNTASNEQSATLQTTQLPANFNQFVFSSPKAEQLEQQAKKLEEQAVALQEEAEMLKDSANTVKKKKIKEQLLADAQTKEQEAQAKMNEAEVLYQQADQEKEQLTELNNKIAENHKKLSSTQLSQQEKNTLAAMTEVEKLTIQNNPDFEKFSQAKQKARRLVKEAEVQYIQIEEIKDEINSQKELQKAIEVLASSSDDPIRKEKSKEQIAEMQRRIEANQNKIKVLQTEAQQKEEQALEENKQAESILAFIPSEDALKFTALEKVQQSGETISDNEILVQNNASENSNNRTQENTTNQNTTTTNEELAQTEENQTINNQQEDVIANNQTTKTEEETTNSTENTLPNNQKQEVTENYQAQENTTTEQETTFNQPENNTSTENSNQNTPVENTTTNIENINQNTITSTNADLATLARQPIPKQISGAYFKIEKNNVSAYNENNPIPKNPPLPEGLIFKVQIGAFRNPIPQDHFKGFAPIMAEDAGNGITRYTAGLFTSFNEADFAKEEIRSIGYSDAFVVAFYNGKRISIPEARKIMEQQGLVAENNSNSNNTTINNNNNSTTSSTNTTTESPQITIENQAPEIDNVSTNVQNIKGVFYTIQVGVYSKPVTEGILLTIKPLNSEKTANGYIRYTSGRYTNLNKARQAKERINKIIPDAFITAYHNGKRIPVSQAQALLATQPTNNTQQTTTNTNTNNETVTQTQSPENNTNSTNESTTNTTTETKPNKPVDKLELIEKADSLNIEFKVLLGKYNEEVPIEDAAKLLKLTGRGVKVFEQNNYTYYTIGSYADYQAALNTQLEMRQLGFNNAEIIAFKNGNIIPTEQALELIKE